MKIGMARRPVCDAEVDFGNPEHVACVLGEYNSWRRGLGKYSFSENPEEDMPFPFSNRTLGLCIDSAIRMLNSICEKK